MDSGEAPAIEETESNAPTTEDAVEGESPAELKDNQQGKKQ